MSASLRAQHRGHGPRRAALGLRQAMPSPVARLSGENTMLVPGPGGPEPHPAAAAAAPDGAAETETYIRCELRSDRLPYGEGRREGPRPPVSGCHYLAFIAGQGGVSGAGPKPGREI